MPGSDAPAHSDLRRARQDVSIHAPRCRGAMQPVTKFSPVSMQFQSTLPVAGERCPPGARTACRRFSRFNPRSPLPGSDASCKPPSSSIVRSFQSTLPVAGERCGPSGGQTISSVSFNPRSPLPGSDALIPTWANIVDLVSIHAPRCRGAMPAVAVDLLRDHAVSIHAPRCRGAMPSKSKGGRPTEQFQSTLPVAGERC